MDIFKAVIPTAGLGSRFLPATKSIPKEMIPLLNKPAIQYIIEEGLDSALSDYVFITRKGKESIMHHFEEDRELELFLKERSSSALMTRVDRIIRSTNFAYVMQPEPLGLGHAIWCARNTIGKEYFSVLLPDDIMISKPPAIAQLIKIARQEKASVIAVQEVPMEATPAYGVIDIRKQITTNLFQVDRLVEKPAQHEAPSNLAIIGRYVLSHKLFPALEEIEADESGELQLTDGIAQMIKNNEKVYAFKVQGVRYDIGNPLGWIKATIGCALQHPDYASEINKFLSDKELIDSFYYNPNKISERSL